MLQTDGSLFLNVGAKPKDPWTALDVAQAARPHLELQNIIHWVKSIAIEKALAGSRAGTGRRPGRRPLQADQQRAVPERLSRVRLPFQPDRRHPARSAGGRREVPGQVERHALAASRLGAAVPRQHLVPPLRHHPEPRQGAAPSGDVPVAAAGLLPEAARPAARCGWPPIHSWDWGAPRWHARRWGSASSASSSTRTTWPRRSQRTEARAQSKPDPK